MASSEGTLNRISLIGYLAKEAEKHSSDKGSAVAFPLMTHHSWMGKDGKKQKKTDFHRVVFFGEFGERMYTYLAKGKKLFIEGELHNNSYTNKDGEKRFSSEITGDRLIFLDRKSPNGKGGDDEVVEDPEKEEEE